MNRCKNMSFVPERMLTVKVVAPLEYSRNLLRFISSCEDIEIIDIQKKPFNITSYEHGTMIKEYLEEFQQVIADFEVEKRVGKRIKKVEIDDRDSKHVLKQLQQFYKEYIIKLKQLNDRISLAERELQKNKSIIDISRNLATVGFSFEDLDEERPYFTMIFGRINTKLLPRFKWNLDAITDSNFVLRESSTEGNYSFLAIGFLERYQEDVNRLLIAYDFEKITIPERISGEPKKVEEKSLQKIEELEAKIKEYHLDAEKIIEEKGAFILAYYEQLLIEENILRIKNMTRSTKRNIAFWAWLPKKKTSKIEKAILTATEKTGVIEFSKPVFEESEFPTKTSTPKFARVYQTLVNAYGVPGYNEFNSALILQIFFPIMFGIMFADVGHGALFTLLGIYGLTLRNKKLNANNFMGEIQGYFKSGAMLIIVSGISAIIFGVLFGSYFGITHEYGAPKALWFSPESNELHNGAKSVILMLELSLLIGMTHMTIGYILRFLTNIKHKHYKEAFLVTLMWAIMHWALFILVFTFGSNFMNWFSATNSGTFDLALLSWRGQKIPFFKIGSSLWFFLGAFVGPIIILSIYLVTHGFNGIGEILDILLSTLSHTVSYARIFAMNAVHGALSHVFLLTDFVGDGHHLGALNYVGVAIGALVILALEGLFSFIQTLRLQWVEFFGKAGYTGTGFEFKSFAITRKYSQVAP